MCYCVNIEIGSYGNQVELPRPDHMKGRSEGSASDTICVDKCLEHEIKRLWLLGINTTGCCCGHNIARPFIGVIKGQIPLMKAFGYRVMYNNMRPNDEDSFIPKGLSNGTHPEDVCQRCGGDNIKWSAPNEIFNAVIGDGIFCPACFLELATEKGIDDLIFTVRYQ